MFMDEIKEFFARRQEVLYGYADITYSKYGNTYPSALVMAVPYINLISLETYSKELADETDQQIKKITSGYLNEVEKIVQKHAIKYQIPGKNQRDSLDEFPFSLKYAATKAEIGWIGKNDLLITHQYGPRVRLAAILLDVNIKCGKPIMESSCPKGCQKCVQACPYKVFSGRSWDATIKREDIIDYQLCQQKKEWYVNMFGKKNPCGLCMVACPIGMQ
jgi:epoxyqueuosine reductase QueG